MCGVMLIVMMIEHSVFSLTCMLPPKNPDLNE